MDAVYPAQASASALARGRRRRRQESRARPRTTPVTFAEIKEVDEESEECVGGAGGEGDAERRRPDVLEERLGSQFAASRRRRRLALRELSPPTPAAPLEPSPAQPPPADT